VRARQPACGQCSRRPATLGRNPARGAGSGCGCRDCRTLRSCGQRRCLAVASAGAHAVLRAGRLVHLQPSPGVLCISRCGGRPAGGRASRDSGAARLGGRSSRCADGGAARTCPPDRGRISYVVAPRTRVWNGASEVPTACGLQGHLQSPRRRPAPRPSRNRRRSAGRHANALAACCTCSKGCILYKVSTISTFSTKSLLPADVNDHRSLRRFLYAWAASAFAVNGTPFCCAGLAALPL
jgi:hypothetical protein